VGFYQPHLISALDSLGIHVSNVIKLNLEREDQSEATTETAAEENHHSPEDQGKLLRISLNLFLSNYITQNLDLKSSSLNLSCVQKLRLLSKGGNRS